MFAIIFSKLWFLKSFKEFTQRGSPNFLEWHQNFSRMFLIPLHLSSSSTLFSSHPPLSLIEPHLWSTKLAWSLCCSFHIECSFSICLGKPIHPFKLTKFCSINDGLYYAKIYTKIRSSAHFKIPTYLIGLRKKN